MSTDPATMNWRDYVGRFSVELEVANHEDVVKAESGFLPPEQVRRTRISGIVDTGATRLVLPASVVTALGFPETGQVTVKSADGRREPKKVVGDVQVEIQGRSSVFTAVAEAGRADALIGAIVLEELDFVPDCNRQALLPRDPLGLFAEIDEHHLIY
jgi:predicted aspartyl protease